MLAAVGISVATVPVTIGLLLTLPQSFASILLVGAFLAGLSAALLAIAAAIAIVRQKRIHDGKTDLYLALNTARSEGVITKSSRVPARGNGRRWLARTALGHHLLVGDLVRIRSLEEIKETLDADGTLDGLPFMDEMAACCGRTARVYRIVDKIYDYGRSRKMRRLDGAVLLVGLRCDGSGHGGCEAACYLIWKRQWLERVDAGLTFTSVLTETTTLPLTRYPRVISPAREQATLPTNVSYRCQYTQLSAATRPLARFDLRRVFGALIVGNVTMGAFLIAALTRYFNFVQTLRQGVRFPSMPGDAGVDSDGKASPLRPGQRVRVRTPEQIALTLDRNSKNKGLWFDADMLKHCGQVHRVLGRVERIIDVNSGRSIPMKTPCVALADVHYSGEFQWFGEQHDFLYWREAWLDLIDEPLPPQPIVHETRNSPAR
jgi:hypothetical protein